jgi:hypothetical protein
LPKKSFLARWTWLGILQSLPKPSELLLVHLDILLMGLALEAKLLLEPTEVSLKAPEFE